MTATRKTPVSVVGRRLRRDGRAADTGRLKVNAAPAVSVFLRANPRPAKIFLDTGLWQLAGHISPGRRWGWDGASLESVSESHDDLMSRLETISDSTGGLASYDYLGAGTVASVSYPQPGLSLDYSADNFAAWDQLGEVVDQIWAGYGQNNSGTVDGYSYTYDQSGNRLTRANLTETNGALDETYTYDGLDRLTSVARGEGQSQTQTEGWTLDSLGNFMGYNTPTVSQTRVTDAANEIQTITQNSTPSTQGYDAAGNMTTIADPNNPNGTLTCTFDAWDRLTEVQDSNGNAIAKYQYDGTGRLVEELSNFSGSTPGTVTYSFYDGQNAIETRQGTVSGNSIPAASTLSPQYQYVFSPLSGKTPILRDSTFDESGNPTSAGRLYYTSDANTNVTGLVDASGQVVERYYYSAYGNVTFCDASWAPLTSRGTNTTTTPGVSSAVGNTTLYASMVLDPATGLFNDEARWYDSSTSVFVSMDPARADQNLYRYCGNDPLGAVDPTGTDTIIVFQPQNPPPELPHWFDLTARQHGEPTTGSWGQYGFVATDWRLSPAPPRPPRGAHVPPDGWIIQHITASFNDWNPRTGRRIPDPRDDGLWNYWEAWVVPPVAPGGQLHPDPVNDIFAMGTGIRHTHAYELASEGTPLHVIQAQLGHRNAASGKAKVQAPSGTVDGKTFVLGPGAVLKPGFHDGGAEKTCVTGGHWYWRKEVPIAVYDPTLSRTSGTGSGGKRAYSTATGRITILQIKKVGN